ALVGTSDDPGGANASGVASVAYQYSSDGSTWVTTPPTWDTVGPPAVDDGVYELQLVVTDNAGNVFTTPAITNVRVDNTPPTATMGNPGSPLRTTVTLSSTTGDAGGSGLASVQYEASRNGGAYTPISATWNTAGSGDGTYSLRVVATDVAGNVTTSA